MPDDAQAGVDYVVTAFLGLPDDAREYGGAAAMLDHLGVTSIRLMTNNPEKVRAMRALGITIESQRAVVVGHNAFSAPYLEAKRLRMGHVLPTILPAEAPAATEERGERQKGLDLQV